MIKKVHDNLLQLLLLTKIETIIFLLPLISMAIFDVSTAEEKVFL